jgi:peptidoglycan/xylan/chitin deacetylase (PgdA/CDA1 family)
VKSVAAASDLVVRPTHGVVVLAYHRVGGGTTLELDLEPAVFAAQMTWLAERQRAVDLDDALEALAEGTGPASVVVTFDDGTADFVDHALPALVDAGVPATYYIATAFIEEQRSFPDAGTPMTWSGLSEAISTGLVTVGSHTHTHAVLDKLDPVAADDELRRSAELIEDRLGVPADHFAYPKGVFGGEANEACLARYYRSAALANCGVNGYDTTDAMRLDRSPVQRSDAMTYFKKKVDGGMQLEGKLRAALNRRRYDAAAN